MKNPIQSLNIRAFFQEIFPDLIRVKIVETNFEKTLASSKAATISKLNSKKRKIKMIGRGRMAWVEEEETP